MLADETLRLFLEPFQAAWVAEDVRLSLVGRPQRRVLGDHHPAHGILQQPRRRHGQPLRSSWRVSLVS